MTNCAFDEECLCSKCNLGCSSCRLCAEDKSLGPVKWCYFFYQKLLRGENEND